MFKKLDGKKKGQNTAEYAILISLVVAAIIAMQTYVQRAIQARIRGAVAVYMTNGTEELGNVIQYEPYYLDTAFNVTRDVEDTIRLDNGISGMHGTTNITREAGGYQSTDYQPSIDPLNRIVNGL